MNEYVFTYGVAGREAFQDYNGGYTMVHAPDMDTAINLFLSVHPRHEPYKPSFAGLYTVEDIARKNLTYADFGECHDHIIYTVGGR